MVILNPNQYRKFYGIRSRLDCQCAAEDVAAGFITLDEGDQLELFSDASMHEAWDLLPDTDAQSSMEYSAPSQWA